MEKGNVSQLQALEHILLSTAGSPAICEAIFAVWY